MKLNLFFYLTTCLTVASLIAPDLGFAKDNIIILEGRKILLRDDGGWEYLSKDRYAITHDGRQVILKDNGEWKYAEKDESIKVTPMHYSDKSLDTLVMQLQKAELESILTRKGKRSIIDTQSVFFIDINNASHAQSTFTLSNSDINNISVTDDKNNEYKVLAIQPETSLKPGETGTVQIRIDGSPSVLNRVTFMYVNFNPAINGISKQMTVKAKWNNFIEKSVDEFSY